MCRSCWVEYGSPSVDSLAVREAVQRIRETEFDQGELKTFHAIVVDDWNIRPEHEAMMPEWFQVLTLDERASALAIVEGIVG